MVGIAFFRTFATMKTIGYWIEAMRLRTLPVSIAGVVMACGYAIAHGAFVAWPAMVCLLFAIMCQTASNFANEYYDYRAGRDRRGRSGPRRGVTEGEIKPEAMKRATYMLLIAASILGLTLTLRGGLWLIAAGAIIGVGALCYSTGPYPLSTHCLGEAAVVIFFGVVPVNLTYYVQTLQWSATVAAGSAAIGLMGANVLIVNNYRDIPDDRAAGKHTLATALPPQAMPILYTINAVAASILTLPAWTAIGPLWAAVPAIYTVGATQIAMKMRHRTGSSLTPLLGMTAVSMAAFSLIFLIANLCN